MGKYKLYVKESPLGKLYLGKTERAGYEFKYYRGSGKVWKQHLNKHNFTWKDITTYVLVETDNREELVEKGIFWSTVFNVVKNIKWANLKPEEGDGGFTWNCKGIKRTPEQIENNRRAKLGNKCGAGNKGKVHSEESKRKASIAQIGKVMSVEAIAKRQASRRANALLNNKKY